MDKRRFSTIGVAIERQLSIALERTPAKHRWLMSFLNILTIASGLKPFKSFVHPNAVGRLRLLSPLGSCIWLMYIVPRLFKMVNMTVKANMFVRGTFASISTWFFIHYILSLQTLFILFYALYTSGTSVRLFKDLRSISKKLDSNHKPHLLGKAFIFIASCFTLLLVLHFILVPTLYFGVLWPCGISKGEKSHIIMFIITLCVDAMESPQIGLPVIIFVVVCHYMACAFQQHRHHLINCTILGRNFLETSWRDYVEMVHVVKRLNSLTAFFIFMNACCAVIVSCLGFFYLIHGQALHVTNSTVDTDLLLNDLSFWILRKNVLLMVFCFVGYCLGAIHLNEQIHKIRHCVLELESGEDIEPYVYRFISMANDRTNGLTMGTFFVMERGSLFTTMSLIFSLVLMWLRFSLTEEREQWSWYKNQSLVINCDDYLEAQI